MLTTQDFKSIFAGFNNCSKKSKRAQLRASINVCSYEFTHTSRTRKNLEKFQKHKGYKGTSKKEKTFSILPFLTVIVTQIFKSAFSKGF